MEQHNQVSPTNWPRDIRYLTIPVHSTRLKDGQITQLRNYKYQREAGTKQCLPVVQLPLESNLQVEINCIHDPQHPAFNQFGLFATQLIQPDSLVVPYLGLVHSNDDEDTDSTSDYDLSLNREAQLSVDASAMGNESRMVNDYRGVPRPISVPPTKKGEKLGPNAEFRDLWFAYEDGAGELGIGIFVLGAGKSGKRSCGILKGEEILVNYGKGFWKERATQ